MSSTPITSTTLITSQQPHDTGHVLFTKRITLFFIITLNYYFRLHLPRYPQDFSHSFHHTYNNIFILLFLYFSTSYWSRYFSTVHVLSSKPITLFSSSIRIDYFPITYRIISLPLLWLFSPHLPSNFLHPYFTKLSRYFLHTFQVSSTTLITLF